MEKLLNDYKITFAKGDTYALAVKLKNITNDLSSAYFTVKENVDGSPLIQKTLGAGISLLDDRAYKQEKTYKIQLQSEDTANLEPLVQYLYDFRVAFGNVVQTILSGVFVVNHSISNVSTISTTTLDVAIENVLEIEFSTTPATQGIEYENDPVACAKIGDLRGLSTTNKETVVKAINEVNSSTEQVKNTVDEILNGDTSVSKADNADEAKHATSADKATSADNADEAKHATSADNADEAKHATSADKATSADNAKALTKLDIDIDSTGTRSVELTEAGLYYCYYRRTFNAKDEYVTASIWIPQLTHSIRSNSWQDLLMYDSTQKAIVPMMSNEQIQFLAIIKVNL